MTKKLKHLIKTYDKKIIVDKICKGKYDTYSPHSTTLHRHNDFQIVWIAKGTGVHFVEKQKYVYNDGSIFLLAPHFMHQMEYNKDVEGFVVSFSDTFFDNHQYKSTLLFYNSKECFLKIPTEEQKLLNTEFTHLYHYLKDTSYVDKDIILQNYLHIILTKINAYSKLSKKGTTNLSNYHLLERFIILVRDHFQEEKNLEFYQNHLAVSQRKLNDVISTITGIPPAKFIEQYALNEAARMISFSSYRIKEIAAIVGYLDNSYFTKAFKKHFSKTPAQYKKNCPIS